MSMPVIKLRQSVQFPANVYGDGGIAVTKTNGNYTVETDWSGLGTTTTLPTSPTNYVLSYDTATGVYVLVPSSVLGGGGGGGGGIPEAPVNGSSYGRINAAWGLVAPLNSPALTGTPTTPTAAPGTDTTQIASTAFVLANAGTTVPPATVAPVMDGVAAVGATTKYAREDHVHPSDTSRAATSHTHVAANVTDFSEAVDDRVGSLLVAGTNITLSYNDAGDALTITSTASGSGGGDVVGPASAVADRIATFNGTTGKLIKDGGTLISALQPIDADLTAIAALSGTGIARRTAATPTWTVGDAVANADLATMATNTLKANATGGTATPTDVTIAGLTTKTTPTTGDWLMISDTAASGAFKKAAWPAGVTAAALSRTNDTNVTLTLGGTPTTALLQATSITMGWSGTLAAARGGFGADVSAQSGVPLFSTGTATFTATTGTGNFVRAADPTLTAGLGAAGAAAGSLPGSGNTNTGFSILDAGDGAFVSVSRASANCAAFNINVDASSVLLMRSGTQVGSINVTTTTTAYAESSDARLKDDLRTLEAAASGNIVDDTNVYDFAWKSTGERSYGVVAQQAVEVYPAAIVHDEERDWWGVDYGKYVPVLLNELKSLRARVAELEVMAGVRPPPPKRRR